MNTGYRIELTENELNVILTACSVRENELIRFLDSTQGLPGAREHIRKQYNELHDVLPKLRNAEYFIETGAKV